MGVTTVGLLRADLAAGGERQNPRRRRRGDRQLLDARALRRHPRLRRPYRQAVWAWDPGRPTRTRCRRRPTPTPTTRPTPGSRPRYDPALGLVYMPMGVQTPDIWGGNRDPLAERYSSALVALDINTGKRRLVLSRPCIMISGTWICRRSRPWSTCRRRTASFPPSCSRPRPATCSCSTAAPGSRSSRRPSGPCRRARRRGDHVAPTQPFSELTFRPAAEPHRRRHVGRHDLRPARLPHPVPSAALRGHVHAAVAAGDAGLPGQSRHVRMGRHRGRSGAPDRHRQPDRHAVRLEAASRAARTIPPAPERCAPARQRDRRAADVRHALRRRAAPVPVADRPALPAAALGLHGRDRPEDEEDRLDAQERHHPRQRPCRSRSRWACRAWAAR